MTVRADRVVPALVAVGLCGGCTEDVQLLPDSGIVADATPEPDAPPPEPVELIADDPFEDGTPFAFVAGFAGQVYLGPSQNGTGALRFAADGSSPEIVAFQFPEDVTGNSSNNGSGAPYPSIGRTGCAPGTAECGPDDEDGRGLFASGTFGDAEWLVVGGARSAGDLDYVYMTQQATSPLVFRYVDLSPEQGGQTKGFSSMHAFGDRLYMGFPDTGGNRPYMQVLITPPAAPGLDAVKDVDFINLDAHQMPDLQTPNNSIIDSIGSFGDRLYVANAGGWVRSTVATPTDSSETVSVTPSAAEFTAKTSVSTLLAADIEPTDKAVPQMAVFGGRLYAARNTTDGPQLWGCNPALTAPATDCDAGDWTLVAANSAGDTQLSQFDNPNNTSVAMLVATPDHLYVGYDNMVDGVVLFRASAPPVAAGDFETIADSGFGDAANTRVFDAKALALGGTTFVYVVVGNGASGLRVYRLDQ